jgi:hypothetical protein
VPRPGKPPRYTLLKRIALGFPEAHEIFWHGDPWFNVGTKSFALFSSQKGLWIFKLPHPQQMMLFDARPEIFSAMRAGRMVWSFVDVEKLDTAEIKDLLEAAWRMVTPKYVQRQYGQLETSPKQIR